MWKKVNPDAIDLIKNFLVLDPVTRWSAGEAENHPWITGHLTTGNTWGTQHMEDTQRGIRSKFCNSKTFRELQRLNSRAGSIAGSAANSRAASQRSLSGNIRAEREDSSSGEASPVPRPEDLSHLKHVSIAALELDPEVVVAAFHESEQRDRDRSASRSSKSKRERENSTSAGNEDNNDRYAKESQHQHLDPAKEWERERERVVKEREKEKEKERVRSREKERERERGQEREEDLRGGPGPRVGDCNGYKEAESGAGTETGTDLSANPSTVASSTAAEGNDPRTPESKGEKPTQ
jgi:serine/threonine protein kinase